MSVFAILVGILAVLAGVGMLVVAIRNRGDGDDPRSTAMLIAGMMVATFGLLIAGFTIAYAAGEPASAGAVQ